MLHSEINKLFENEIFYSSFVDSDSNQLKIGDWVRVRFDESGKEALYHIIFDIKNGISMLMYGEFDGEVNDVTEHTFASPGLINDFSTCKPHWICTQINRTYSFEIHRIDDVESVVLSDNLVIRPSLLKIMVDMISLYPTLSERAKTLTEYHEMRQFVNEHIDKLGGMFNVL